MGGFFLYTFPMKKIINYFTLGAEYEELEFELSVLPERLLGIDSYLYIGEGFNTELKDFKFEIELLYEWELLKALIITFETGNLQSSKAIRNAFKNGLNENEVEIQKGVLKVTNSDRILYLIEQEEHSILLIGTPNILRDLLISI